MAELLAALIPGLRTCCRDCSRVGPDRTGTEDKRFEQAGAGAGSGSGDVN